MKQGEGFRKQSFKENIRIEGSHGSKNQVDWNVFLASYSCIINTPTDIAFNLVMRWSVSKQQLEALLILPETFTLTLVFWQNGP